MPRGKKIKSPIFKAISEIRAYIARLDEEILDKQAEREELIGALGVFSGETPRPQPPRRERAGREPSAERGKRMPRKEMQAALENLQSGLKKGEEYTREQVAAAAKVAPASVQSLLIRAKAKKLLKSNGQRGRGGRWVLA